MVHLSVPASETEAQVVSWGRGGRGVLHAGSRRFYLPFVIPGERVRFRHDPATGAAILTDIIEASPFRVDAGCSQAPRCPGCAYRHLAYPEQAGRLLDQVFFALRQERISALPVPPRLIPYPTPSAYRTRARLRLLHRTGAVIPGMPSHPGYDSPVDLTHCPNHHPALNDLAQRVSEALRRISNDGNIHAVRELRLEISPAYPGMGRVILVAEEIILHYLHRRLSDFMRLLPGDTGVFFLPLTRRNDRPARRVPSHISGPPTLPLLHRDTRFQVPAGAWTPVSEHGADLLTGYLANIIPAKAETTVLEIGCGIGLQSILPAQRGFDVTGIDEDGAAIRAATDVSRRMPERRLRFRQGHAEHALRRLAARGFHADTVVLHGMRRPFGVSVIRLLPLLGTRRMILISPSPRALALDVRTALDTGFHWNVLTLMDQIPHTTSVLAAAALEK